MPKEYKYFSGPYTNLTNVTKSVNRAGKRSKITPEEIKHRTSLTRIRGVSRQLPTEHLFKLFGPTKTPKEKKIRIQAAKEGVQSRITKNIRRTGARTVSDPNFSKLSKVAKRFGKSALILSVLESMRDK